MNKLLILFALAILSQNLMASDLCSRNSDDVRNFLDQSSSRISFKNDGGLFNQGVCWWHNRLQRSSAYLVTFDPQLPRPSRSEVTKILHSLRNMDAVVVIPGYEDFLSFSRDHQKEIQTLLDGWQKFDGFYNFEWIRGISGRSSLSADEMKLRMKEVYSFYSTSPAPLWIMAQMKGVTSHAFLILRMFETGDGYQMELIDSNAPQKTLTITYVEGESALRSQNGKYSFVPYVGFQNDYKKIATALNAHCGNKNIVLDIRDLKDGEVER